MAKFLLSPDNINSENSFVIENIELSSPPESQSLEIIVPIGDLNGDNINELLIEESFNSFTDNFVIFGNSSFPEKIEPAEIDGTNGFFINDSVDLENAFLNVNGDEFGDLALRLPEFDSLAIILGGNQFPETINLDTLDGSNGFTVSDDGRNASINVTRDINNDGIKDLLFTSSTVVDDSLVFTSKMVFGRENYPASLDISDLDGNNGFSVNAIPLSTSNSNTQIDFNGDEFGDLILFDENTFTDYVVFGGSEFAAELDLNNLASGEGFAIVKEEEAPGFIAEFSQDINGDGLDDIVVSNSPPGSISIIYGSEENTATTFELASIDGNNGFTIAGETSLTTILDINGDGLQDLFIRNQNDDKIYVIFGGENIPNNFDLSTLDGSNGFVIENSPILIYSFDSSGDINGDGIDDLRVRIFEDFDPDSIDGFLDSDYILLGSEEFPASIDLTDLDTNAIKVSGEGATKGISTFSDVNGDDIDDIIFDGLVEEENDSLASSTILFGDRDLSFVSENTEPRTIELFRFRNITFDTGTYIFVGEAERDSILNDPNLQNTFALEGVAEDGTANPAFTASTVEGEGLIPFYRLESLTTLGTFLFVSTAEYNSIFEDPNQSQQWKKQGFDQNDETMDIPEFYTRDNDAEAGEQFNRFQNRLNGTYIYTGERETEFIESSEDLLNVFDNQGPAFRSINEPAF